MKRYLIPLISALLLMACGKAQDLPITDLPEDALKEGAMLVDVRTPEEFGEGHLEGALNIDWYEPDFASRWEGVDKDKTIYVYCKVGGRSAQAAQLLDSLGFRHVVNLTGGYDAYLAAKKP